LLVLAGELDSLRGALAGLLQAARQQIRLAQMDDRICQNSWSAHGDRLLHPVFRQRQTRGDSSIQSIC
jgi:hypothetical protein